MRIRVISLADFTAGLQREDPLESELRQQMATALRAVPGVDVVAEEDRELWYVTGAPSGEALIRAAAQVVDHLARTGHAPDGPGAASRRSRTSGSGTTRSLAGEPGHARSRRPHQPTSSTSFPRT